jgi:hypothetical protein
MTLQRRTETRTDTMRFGGRTEEFTYSVEVWVENLPAPSQDVAVVGGRADVVKPTPATFVEGQGWAAPETPAPAKRRPTREEYLAAFFAAGPAPECVQQRYNRVHAMLWEVARRFQRRNPPRRVRVARDRVVLSFVGIYDHGTIARLAYHLGEHDRRHRAHTANLDLYAARLWAREGTPRPLIVGAVLSAKT